MKLHVAVAGWLLGPPSGANRRLLQLVAHAAALLATGERITVLHAESFAPPADDGVRWQPVAIPAAPTIVRARQEARLLPALLRELDVTVFDHGFLPLPNVAVPTCLLVHDTRAADGLTRWPRWLARAVLRRSLRRADAIVVPSEWTARRLALLAPGSRPATVVPNGVDMPAREQPAPPRPLPANGYLLHTGHLEPRKNLDVVVRALAALPADHRPELWLVGRDAGTGAALAQLPFVHWFGAIDDDELPPLYRHARAVVVPSRHEGFGLCALEGLAHGRPVLASDCGALPEVLGGHGQLLPPDDPAAWAVAIAATAAGGDDAAPERRTRAQQFAWSAAAARLVAVWRRLHAQRASAPGG